MPTNPPSAPAAAPPELDVDEPARESAAVETSEGDAAALLRRAVIDHIVHDPALLRLPGRGTVVDVT